MTLITTTLNDRLKTARNAAFHEGLHAYASVFDEAIEALKKPRPRPTDEQQYALLLDRLRSYVNYCTRDNDPEYGRPLDPFVSLKKWFEAQGLGAAANVMDELQEIQG